MVSNSAFKTLSRLNTKYLPHFSRYSFIYLLHMRVFEICAPFKKDTVLSFNCIEEESKERKAAGSRAYYVYKKTIFIKIDIPKGQSTTYNTLIRPTVTYGSETWVLKENVTNKLNIFGRRIMREIYGRTRTDDGYWSIKTDQEINDILKGQNIIGFIKKQRLNWLGHVERMVEDNIVQKIKRRKPMSKRPIGRPKTRWEDDVLEDIKSINISNWKTEAQN